MPRDSRGYGDQPYGYGGYGGYPLHFRGSPPPQWFSNYGYSGHGYGVGGYGAGGYGSGGFPSYGQGGYGQFGYGEGYPPTLFGLMDGVNGTFSTGVILRTARVFRNGATMTRNVDVVHSGQFIVFLKGQIPQPGDLLLVMGWV